MAKRYEVIHQHTTPSDPHYGVFNTYDKVTVTVHDTETGKTATGVGHAIHTDTGATVPYATERAIDDAQRKLGK